MTILKLENRSIIRTQFIIANKVTIRKKCDFPPVSFEGSVKL